MLITSRRNPRILDALQLRDRRDRQRRQQFLMEGVLDLRRAERAGVRLETLFICDPWLDEAARDWLAHTIVPASSRLLVAPAVMEKLAYGKRREGIIALAAALPSLSLRNVVFPPKPLVVVLEAVEKPGNLGAVLRSAAAAGAHAVIVADGFADRFNPNVIRASMGAAFSVPCVACTRDEVWRWLAQAPAPVFAAWVNPEAADYARCDYTQGAVFVLGAEARGLAEPWLRHAHPITIPMQATIVDSLNLSNAAAILLFEARRQARI